MSGYQAPQIRNSRNIITDRRVRMKVMAGSGEEGAGRQLGRILAAGQASWKLLFLGSGGLRWKRPSRLPLNVNPQCDCGGQDRNADVLRDRQRVFRLIRADHFDEKTRDG